MAVTACATGDGAPRVSDARIGQPTGPNAALYFTVNADGADRLVGARTTVASSVQIHETVIGDDGTSSMHEVGGIDVATGEEVALEPGGLHLMLVEVTTLEAGDRVEVVLDWEEAGEMVIEAEVVAPDETMGDGGG